MFALTLRSTLLCLLLALSPHLAHAQFAVVDVGAIAQLIEQVRTLQEQLTTARDQLTQAREQYESMTGGRNMERLLAGTARNYLPPDWAALEAALRQASADYQTLAAQLQAAIGVIAVLSPEQVALLSAEEREALEGARRTSALLQVTVRQALASTSTRFASIQALIDAIASARDPKAIFDLQARIAAEQGMLTNEQTKLQVLYQTAQAEEWARRQRTREQALAGIGSLRGRPPLRLPLPAEGT